MPRLMWMPLVGLAASGCVIQAQSRSDAVSFDEPIVGVVADVGAGDLVVTGTAIEGAEVFQVLEWSGSEPDVTIEVVDQVLYLTVECRKGHLRCRADSELIVPEGAWLSLETGAGDLDIKGTAADVGAWTGAGDVALAAVSGSIEIETGSGDISMTDVAGAVFAHTGSGEVFGRQLAASVLGINTGSGNIDLASERAPSDVDISTGSGDVELTVPSGVYALDITTGAGDVDVSGITRQDSADQLIEIDTGSGDVSVRGR